MDYNKGFVECSESALRHYHCADILADSHYFDIAVGHLILGAEESLKSLVYYSNIVDFLNIEEIPGVFKDHRTRHIQLAKIHEDCLKAIEIFVQNCEDVNAYKFLELVKETSTFNAREIRKWWQNANELKNKGWYVTYSNGTWITPKQIEKSDFDKARAVIMPLSLSLIIFKNLRELESEKK